MSDEALLASWFLDSKRHADGADMSEIRAELAEIRRLLIEEHTRGCGFQRASGIRPFLVTVCRASREPDSRGTSSDLGKSEPSLPAVLEDAPDRLHARRS